MLLTVEAPDAQSAMALVQRLVGVVGGEAVALDGSGGEVRVDAVNESDGTLGDALDAVESWLVDFRLDDARVRCDGRTYRLGGMSRRRRAGLQRRSGGRRQ